MQTRVSLRTMNYVRALSAPDVLSYHHGLSQPAQMIQLRLGPIGVVGTAIDWPTVDAWLAERLHVVCADGSPLPTGSDPGSTAAVPYFWRVLQTAAALLRAVGVPVFEPGKLLTLHQDAATHGYWLAEAAIPQVDYFSASATANAFEAAAILVLGLAARPEDFSDAEALYRQLDATLIRPLGIGTTTTPATLVLLHAASQRDIPWRHEGGGIYRLGWGAKGRHFHGSRSAADSSLGANVAGNKFLTAQWLRRVGLPAPVHHLVNDAEQAQQAAQGLGWPVVVKPLQGERGEGVSVDVCDAAGLTAAYVRAAKVGQSVLVERQVDGHCHRLLVVRGKVLYVVKRLPIAVLADGRHTVAQLIRLANAAHRQRPPWNRPALLPADDLAQACLQSVGLTLDAVPAEGTWAPLRRIESTADGGRDEDMMERLHPDNAALACRAAATLGLEIAGVDVMTTDIGVPWYHTNAIINEVNAAPVLGASQMSLDAMPAMLSQLINGNGRIPVEIFTGGADALVQARARQRDLLASGLACYLTTETLSEDPQGQVLHMTWSDSFRRTRALLMNHSVEALVVVCPPGAWNTCGWPIDRAAGVHECEV